MITSPSDTTVPRYMGLGPPTASSGLLNSFTDDCKLIIGQNSTNKTKLDDTTEIQTEQESKSNKALRLRRIKVVLLKSGGELEAIEKIPPNEIQHILLLNTKKRPKDWLL